MYRLALVSLLPLVLIEMAAACPPAQSRVVTVNGKQVVEWFCPPEHVMFMHENIYRCFPKCDMCPNGFCLDNKCHCFPGAHSDQPGVCGQICPNCMHGWCSSASKCECFDGFLNIEGRCVWFASLAVVKPKEINAINEAYKRKMEPKL